MKKILFLSFFFLALPQAAFATIIFLTSGSSWTVPNDWNNSNNTIEVIGGGGGGGGGNGFAGAGGGGGGGAYSKIVNTSHSPGDTVYISVGTGGPAGAYIANAGSAGGDTWFNNVNAPATSTTGGALAKGGAGGTSGGWAGNAAGGAAASGVGSVKYSGGIGASANSVYAGGGGGAAGRNGSGNDGIAGGAGGSGDAGYGGVGGANANPGGVGGNGVEWDAMHGSGGGGGGGVSPGKGGAGGNYGGGGGGDSAVGGYAGVGAPGLIIISWTDPALQCNGTPEIFSTPGTYTRTIPTYSSMTVEAWGGGGAGGFTSAVNWSGTPATASSFAGVSAGQGGTLSSGNGVTGGPGGTPSGGDVPPSQAGGTGGPGGQADSPSTLNVNGGPSPNGGAGGTRGTGNSYPVLGNPGSPPGGGGAGNITAVFQRQPQPRYYYIGTAGGGGGAYAKKTYTAGTLTPGSPVTVTVGSGGTSNNGAAGAAGQVKITCSQNSPPTSPTISGPTSGVTKTTYTYTFRSTDPDSDTIRYAVDWDGNGSVDEYVPALGYENSGVATSTTHSWNSSNTQTFKARAQDSLGNTSGWTSYTVNMSPNAPVVLLTASPSSIASGQSSTLTWSSSGADSCTATNFTMPNSTVESSTPTVVYLSSGSKWTVPSDWNNSNNTIEVIGGGGGGGFAIGYYSGGGGGGAYSKITNVALTPSAKVAYAVGIGGTSNTSGGDTYFCDSTSNCASIGSNAVVVGAKGGSRGEPTGAGGAGGAAASGIGTTKYSGGNGATGGSPWSGGGAGAAGPNGPGNNASGINGGAGDSGYGGAGGAGGASTGVSGGNGTEWDSSHGSGGGGGGAYPNNGAGGLYGGGSGAIGQFVAAQGIIVITYHALTTGPTTSGTATVSPSTTTTYTVTCTGAGNQQASDSKTVTVTCAPTYSCSGQTIRYTDSSCAVSNGPTCNAPAFCSAGSSSCLYPPPAFNSFTDDTGATQNGHLFARPMLLRAGQTAKIYWNVSNVDSCSVSGGGQTWPAIASPSSGQVTAPIMRQTAYTLTCNALPGNSPTSFSETRTVNIVPVFQEI